MQPAGPGHGGADKAGKSDLGRDRSHRSDSKNRGSDSAIRVQLTHHGITVPARRRDSDSVTHWQLPCHAGGSSPAPVSRSAGLPGGTANVTWFQVEAGIIAAGTDSDT
jgi:hypothetical protein